MPEAAKVAYVNTLRNFSKIEDAKVAYVNAWREFPKIDVQSLSTFTINPKTRKWHTSTHGVTFLRSVVSH